jgi:hypothetical protein
MIPIAHLSILMNRTKIIVMLGIMIDIALLHRQTCHVPFSNLQEAVEARVDMFLCSIGEDSSPVGIGRHVFDEFVGSGEQDEVIEASGVRRLMDNGGVGVLEKGRDDVVDGNGGTAWGTNNEETSPVSDVQDHLQSMKI